MLERLRALGTRAFPPKRRLWLLVVAGLLLGYALVGFFIVPWIMASQLRNRALSQLHRQGTLAKARFNPFTLRTTLVGFDLHDRDGSRLLAFDTLVIDVSTASLPMRAWVLDEFRLIRPAIVARIGADGKPSISDLLVSDSTAPASTTPDSVPQKPPRLVDLYIAQFSKPAFDSLRLAFIVPKTAQPDSLPARAGKPGSLDAPAFYTEIRDRLLAAQPVAHEELLQLAKARADNVAAALNASGTLDSSRVSVTDPAPVKRKKAGSSRVPSEMTLDAK